MSVANVATYPVPNREESMPRLTWRQIADDLEARIQAGEYPPGRHIPSYAQLADMYDVSVTTAAKAVARLADRGLVETDPGRGVLVREVHSSG